MSIATLTTFLVAVAQMGLVAAIVGWARASRHPLGKRAVFSALLVALVANGIVLVPAKPAEGHSGCLIQDIYGQGADPSCAGHWANSNLLFHFSGVLTDSAHKAFRDRFWDAEGTWADAVNPNSPWHVHYSTRYQNHVSMFNSNEPGWLAEGRIRDSNGSDHIGGLQPSCSKVEGSCDDWAGVWLREDIWEVFACGASFSSQCSWYTGGAVPGSTQVDAWGVWVEELGHAQNISHHLPPGHNALHGHAMSPPGFCAATLDVCSYDKRKGSNPLTSHERWHACDPYRQTHGTC